MQQKEYYYYPPKNPQFFFPKEEFKIYEKFYSPYSKKSKYFWALYKTLKIIRFWFKTTERNIPLPISKITKIISLKDVSYFYNIGTRGIHQTATVIAQNNNEKRFLKFTQKEQPKELIKNEIETLLKLNKENEIVTAKILEYNIDNSFSYLLTEVINGGKFKKLKIDNNVFKLLLTLASKGFRNEKTKEVFVHGDFCPWNILVTEDKN